jgi:hypothetical protein
MRFSRLTGLRSIFIACLNRVQLDAVSWVAILRALATACVLVIAAPITAQEQEDADTSVAASSCPFALPNYRLKDHTLFRYRDYFYLAAIRIEHSNSDGRGEYDFAYARTRDFCTWEDLGAILGPGAAGDADEAYIWAPHVVEEGGVFYLFYTGVNRNIAQSIMLATSTNPAEPGSWQKQGVVFRPDHEGMIYGGPDVWSDARDPMVLRYANRYYLFYTGRDVSGGIVGVATMDSLEGAWRDLGAVFQTSALVMPESPFVLHAGTYFYLYYNASGAERSGEAWRWAPSPFGPWQPGGAEAPGWAHDFLVDDGEWWASYILGDGAAIGVTRLRWLAEAQPPRPAIGWRQWLPATIHQ